MACRTCEESPDTYCTRKSTRNARVVHITLKPLITSTFGLTQRRPPGSMQLHPPYSRETSWALCSGGPGLGVWHPEWSAEPLLLEFLFCACQCWNPQTPEKPEDLSKRRVPQDRLPNKPSGRSTRRPKTQKQRAVLIAHPEREAADRLPTSPQPNTG